MIVVVTCLVVAAGIFSNSGGGGGVDGDRIVAASGSRSSLVASPLSRVFRDSNTIVITSFLQCPVLSCPE